ncbi:hypothetical protein MPH_14103, partial [Macrophomina phaseolina MS6]
MAGQQRDGNATAPAGDHDSTNDTGIGPNKKVKIEDDKDDDSNMLDIPQVDSSSNLPEGAAASREREQRRNDNPNPYNQNPGSMFSGFGRTGTNVGNVPSAGQGRQEARPRAGAVAPLSGNSTVVKYNPKDDPGYNRFGTPIDMSPPAKQQEKGEVLYWLTYRRDMYYVVKFGNSETPKYRIVHQADWRGKAPEIRPENNARHPSHRELARRDDYNRPVYTWRDIRKVR